MAESSHSHSLVCRGTSGSEQAGEGEGYTCPKTPQPKMGIQKAKERGKMARNSTTEVICCQLQNSVAAARRCRAAKFG
jgi:hypothetical protein